jgi:hypothetical protein
MTPKCCYIDPLTRASCGHDADWTIVDTSIHAPADGYTEACTEHVGQLLSDSPEHRIYPIERVVATEVCCRRCAGCGQIANSEDGEPWTFWAELPEINRLAVTMGIVKPIPCPACHGTGKQAFP